MKNEIILFNTILLVAGDIPSIDEHRRDGQHWVIVGRMIEDHLDAEYIYGAERVERSNDLRKAFYIWLDRERARRRNNEAS